MWFLAESKPDPPCAPRRLLTPPAGTIGPDDDRPPLGAGCRNPHSSGPRGVERLAWRVLQWRLTHPDTSSCAISESGLRRAASSNFTGHRWLGVPHGRAGAPSRVPAGFPNARALVLGCVRSLARVARAGSSATRAPPGNHTFTPRLTLETPTLASGASTLPSPNVAARMTPAADPHAPQASQPEPALPATVFSPASADELHHQGATAHHPADLEKDAGQDTPASTVNGEVDESAYPTGVKLWIIMAALVSGRDRVGKEGRIEAGG